MPGTLRIALHHLYVCVCGGGGRQPSLQCGLLRRGTTRFLSEEYFLCSRFMQVGAFS